MTPSSERPAAGRPPARRFPEDIPARGRRRPGSRLLLAVALACGAAAAIAAGTWLFGLAADLLALRSVPVRLAIKAAGIAAALPAGFYAVERFFLERASRRVRD